MQYRSKLAELTMADVERLHRIQQLMDAADDAIAATSIQAKPAIRALFAEAHGHAEAIMRKCARQALKLGAGGAYTRKHLGGDLVQRLIQLAEIPQAGEAAANEGESAPVAEDAGGLGIASEAAPAADG